MFDWLYAEQTLPRKLSEYINNESLKIRYEDFDNIFWILIWKNISIKEKMHIYKKRFTIAHEVWHYYHWTTFAFDTPFFSNNPFEKEADEYAINQLVDTCELKELIEVLNFDLEQLENYFWVPKEEILKKIKQIYKSENLNFYF